MGWLLLGLALIYKFDFLDVFIKFDIVDELNLISYKFHYLVYKIWFHISLLLVAKLNLIYDFKATRLP